MTKHISQEQIEASMRYSHQLRAEAFTGFVGAIGRGLRASARMIVGIFA